jgi:hypothetical protein
VKDVLVALNTIESNGVIKGYAIGGAIGASFYIEATSTEDIDAFVFLAPTEGMLLISLSPIYEALRELGGIVEKEYIKIGGWPLQILPAYKPLIEDALHEAVPVEFSGVPTKIFTPEYTCAIALDTGRPKDFMRVAMFIEQDMVDIDLLNKLIDRYGLLDKVKQVSNWPEKALSENKSFMDGEYTGKILRVDKNLGFVYQSKGHGEERALPLSAFSQIPDVSDALVKVTFKDQKAVITPLGRGGVGGR